MFKHILVPVDGSSTSQVAVGKAIVLAKSFDSIVTVIYVIDPYPFTGVGTDFAYGQAEYLSAATAEANTAVQTAKDNFSAAGVTVNTSIVEAHTAWRGIVEAGDSLKADLIVMGSHGRSGLEKLVLGSVAQAVLSHTKLPVLVMRD
ncbi:universal stress protein [Rhodoferax antarcticus]|uniref:Universal stress protein n=1 Tax=Rhodoferax antarcticus ANT.BR TaxID=1111071 RepID=A0A1Q8YF83_9BURK|nr:universal stress protein [Rhodoferax antarcticus]APW46429.1 universal stress protein UspA [Rhodoferax antarcticus]MCW2312475.1 nucleotide-binding universal stress UspA family protein [Rhodoferax antarcticus]OLP06686.1 universal stress family protein [Rhodoferax antarcticus ANT.BR]